jgi:hypothetical protein
MFNNCTNARYVLDREGVSIFVSVYRDYSVSNDIFLT